MNGEIESPRKRSFLTRTLRFFFFFTVAVLLGIGGLMGLLLAYQDEVKAVILTELNKNLNAEVKVDPKNIDLTIIKTFPDCSIQFSQVLMLEALPLKKRDTLLYAGQVNLHFNIRDLWNKNYNIRAIKLRDARIKPVVLKNGSNNYTFWKESEAADTSRLEFRLELVSFHNISVLYKDRQALFKTSFAVKDLRLSGRFSDTDYDLETRGELWLAEVVKGSQTWLSGRSLRLDLSLKAEGDQYVFKRSSLTLNALKLSLEGKFRYREGITGLDVNFDAPGLDIASVLSFLPEQHRQRMADYKSSGDFYARGKVTYNGDKDYSVSSGFGIRNGSVRYVPNAVAAEDIQLDGQLNFSPTRSELLVKNMRFRLGADSISGKGAIHHFNDPDIDLALRAAIRLEDLHAFWPVDTITSIKGKLKIDARMTGLLKDLRDQTFSEKVKFDLLAEVHSLEAKFKDDEKTYAVESCTLLAKDREAEVRDLRLKRGGSDMRLNGKMPGLFNYLANSTSALVIMGRLESQEIRMEDFIGDRKGSAAVNTEPLIPPNISFQLDASIGRFSLGKFVAEKISGDLEIRNQKAIVNEMKLETMDGDAVINAFADNSKGSLDVVIQSRLREINISQLFTQMNNFGQSTLMDHNIKGFVTAEIDFSGKWSNNLDSDPASILATSDLTIRRGQLIEFQPLQSLSRFVDIKELKSISFPSLAGRVEIRNSAIIIPKTAINNSALNIDFWGTHYFDNRIDYHIRLLISELLSKKRKQADDEFGPVESDPENRRSAHLLMTGTVDEPVIRYDKRGLKQKIKEDVQQEKQNIRKILKEELMTFRNTPQEPVKGPHTEGPGIQEPVKDQPKPKTLELKKRPEEDDF